MKTICIAIITGALLLTTVQVVEAQPISQHMRRPVSSESGVDLPSLGRIVTDSMVLPLIGSSDHLDGRIAFLRAELKITQAQLSAWNDFIAAIRSNAQQENEMIGQASSLSALDAPAPSLPQRLEAHEKQLTAHLEMLRKITAALLPLYASFSKEQKNVAEALGDGAFGL